MYRKRNINNELEIVNLYSGDYNKKYYLREISRLTRLPLKTTQNLVNSLENNNYLISSVVGKNKYFSLNLQNIQTKLLLLQAEIYRTSIFLDKYNYFKTFLKSVQGNTPIILFGSFAKGIATSKSDIDLFIISSKNDNLPFHLLPNKLHKIVLKENHFIKSLNDKEPLIREIIENHIIINNHSFYVNLIWEYYGQ